MFKNLNPEALGVSGRDSEVIELVLSYGFKGLDLDVVDFAEQVRADGFAKASRLIVSARLKIGGFRLPVRCDEEAAEYQADLQRLAPLAEVAQQLGCTRAVTTISPGNDLRPYHENFESHRRRLAEVAHVLSGFGIRLGIGLNAPLAARAGCAFQFIQTVDELLLLLSTVDAKNVGLALDTWHWHLGGGKLEQLRALGAEKIVAVTLVQAGSEVSAAEATVESRRLPAVEGPIDLVSILSTLAELRYDGPVTPAADKSQFAGLGRDKIVKAAGGALDAVWKAAGLNAAGRLATVAGR